MPPILTSNASVSELLNAIKAAPQLLGGPGALVARSVVVESNGKWYNHGTVVALIPKDDCPKSVEQIELRQVRLVQRSLVIDDSVDLDAFRDLVTGWRDAVGAPTGYSLQETVQPRRFYSDPRTGSFPRWECNLSEVGVDRPSFAVPDGPLLAPDHNIFAPDVPILAAYWLKASHWSDRNTIGHECRIVIEDRRARITKLRAKNSHLSVVVEAITKEPLFCGASVTPFTGDDYGDFVQVAGGSAEFDFTSAVQRLDLWLMIPGGDALDRYTESPTSGSWGRELSIYNRPPELANPKLATLKVALSSGEGQSIEFKPFIRLRPRDPKSQEIPECVSAFANADGGDLFIGVNDYAEPEGIDDSKLRKCYGKRCQEDIACLRDAYIQDLRLLLNEGLIPPVTVTFDWFDIALTSVLRLHVSSSPAIKTHLIANGDIFARVGATNRKVRPADVI